MKKFYSLLVVPVVVLAITGAVMAQSDPSPSPTPSVTGSPKTVHTGMVSGTLSSKGIDSLSLRTNKGADVTVNITTSTKLVRRFGGKSSLDEFQVGDKLDVTGKITSNSPKIIEARMIRDVSIQAKNGEFTGTISNLNGNSFTLTPKVRKPVQVTVNSDAKIYLNGKAAGMSDLANGMTAKVSGVWDRTMSSLAANSVRASNVKPNILKAKFSGVISGLSGSNFTLTMTKKNTSIAKTAQVSVNSDAKISLNGKSASLTDLQNGQKASVSGVWDSGKTTISASSVRASTMPINM